MSIPEIEKKATEWLNSDEFYKRGSIIETAFVAYVAGAKMMNDAQARFDELNPYQKADFMANNIEWAGCKTLQDEIDARDNYEKSLTKHFEDEDEPIEN